MYRHLIALAALSLASLAASGQAQDIGTVVLKVTAVANGVYLLEGAGRRQRARQ